MTQPQDPTQVPPSTDPSVGDAPDVTVSVTQDQVNTAGLAYANAAQNFDYWQQKVADYAQNPPSDASVASQASTQADSARAAMGKAASDYSTVLNQVASERANQARFAKDPNEQALWAAESDKAKAQADLYTLEAQSAQAKDQATMDSLNARAQAVIQNAQTTATKAASLEQLQSSQSLLANAKAAQIPALTQSTIDLHTSTIQRNAAYVQYLGSRTNLQNAQANTQGQVANLDAAKAALVAGPQAQSMLSKSELDAARAAGLNLDQGATLDKIQAAAHLSDARVLQIYANIGKSQVLPYNDKTEPNLTIFNPYTGNVSGQPNPSYVNTALQGITDTNQAIQQVQQDIASGQMTPDEGTALIDSLRQSLQYKALGVTPTDYVNMQNAQANVGMNVLGKYQDLLSQGNLASDRFQQAAMKSTHQLAPSNAYSAFGQIANALYGPDLKTAQSLISQIQPITDRLSALKNMSLIGQARAALTGAPIAPTASNPSPQQPPAQPTPPAPPAAPTGGPNAAFLSSAAPGSQPLNMQTWEAMGNA